jgi:hypothetical protein
MRRRGCMCTVWPVLQPQLVIFGPNKRHVKVQLLLYTPEDVYVMEMWLLSFLAWARDGDERSA